MSSVNAVNKLKSDKDKNMMFDIKSYGKLSDKLTPRLGNSISKQSAKVKWLNPNNVDRVLRSREKSQRRRDYSEKQRMIQ